MLELRFTSKFKKDYKRLKRQGKDLAKLEATLEMLRARRSLSGVDARSFSGRDVSRPS